MPRVHHVKRARKPNPVVTAEDIERAKSGQDPDAASYYFWEFRFGGKQFSKTPPKQSQLTQSEFLSQAYELNERIEGLDISSDIRDLQSEVEDIIGEIRQLGEEQQEKRDNMPFQLQDSESGALLEERYEACEEWASNLESVDFDVEEAFDEASYLAEHADELQADGLTDEEREEMREELLTAGQEEVDQENADRRQAVLDEIQSFTYEGS